MKFDNINNIIVEGADGVGKSTLIQNIFKRYNYRFMCYHRGEISNFIYAQKYNRPFTATQRLLPFFFIILVCDEKDLKQRLESRTYSSEEEKQCELEKIKDNKLFVEAAKKFDSDYDLVVVDTTGKTAEETAEKVFEILDERFMNFKEDETISEWNQRYVKACSEFGISFKSCKNQPYINNYPILVESTLHNGLYESFTDKRFPDNLLYSLAYDRNKIIQKEKVFDFTYVINSKIKRRPEIFEYYANFIKNEKTCQIADNPLIEHDFYLHRISRVFGEDFISELSKANATVYCSRDLAYLELQTARLYESILANLIVFVDKESDPASKILKQIYPDNPELAELLTCTPENICQKYEMISQSVKEKILNLQHKFYDRLFDDFNKGLKENKVFVLNEN